MAFVDRIFNPLFLQFQEQSFNVWFSVTTDVNLGKHLILNDKNGKTYTKLLKGYNFLLLIVVSYFCFLRVTKGDAGVRQSIGGN